MGMVVELDVHISVHISQESINEFKQLHGRNPNKKEIRDLAIGGWCLNNVLGKGKNANVVNCVANEVYEMTKEIDDFYE